MAVRRIRAPTLHGRTRSRPTTSLSVRFTIGEVSRRVGCSPTTLRLWERKGLIAPERTPSGYRMFTHSDLVRLRKIAHLQRVEGLNPAGISQILGDDEGQRTVPSGAELLGRRLRRLRLSREWPLEKVAAGAGLSVSFLSSVERDKTGVSMANLRRLLGFYGTTLAALFRTEGDAQRVTRAGKRATISDRFRGVRIEQLAQGDVEMEAQLFEIRPGSGSDGGYEHEGEEFIYVIDGALEVVLDHRETYLLAKGDCLYFPSTLDHNWRNPSKRTTHLLWVNTPATF